MVLEDGISPMLRPMHKSVNVTAGGFDHATAVKAVEEGYDNTIAIGRDFITTPDIVERLKEDNPLNDYNTKTFCPREWTHSTG
ncbi:12-oxophytodienoate reductase [Phytophthora megakarya]|uniref:12-oxophytodienoate reductase n=1 Tax=Phytophthora megakarya TaxID=4795 RepID=A0A225VTP5_9STRA|nr:12-oxophytodienoate reductase [Phytophthora megakarya]